METEEWAQNLQQQRRRRAREYDETLASLQAAGDGESRLFEVQSRRGGIVRAFLCGWWLWAKRCCGCKGVLARVMMYGENGTREWGRVAFKPIAHQDELICSGCGRLYYESKWP